MRRFIQAGLLFLLISVTTGIFYPLIVTGSAELLWPELGHGSLIKEGELVRGSALIAQRFDKYEYFWPRPSATDYSAMPSGGSNLGPMSKKLRSLIKERREKLAAIHNCKPEEVPDIMVTASGSGVDPALPLNAVLFQLPRVAQARKLNDEGQNKLRALVEEHLVKPFFVALGPSYINVLLLNIAIDEAFGKMEK